MGMGMGMGEDSKKTMDSMGIGGMGGMGGSMGMGSTYWSSAQGLTAIKNIPPQVSVSQ
jgi:hypothetical protein